MFNFQIGLEIMSTVIILMGIVMNSVSLTFMFGLTLKVLDKIITYLTHSTLISVIYLLGHPNNMNVTRKPPLPATLCLH